MPSSRAQWNAVAAAPTSRAISVQPTTAPRAMWWLLPPPLTNPLGAVGMFTSPAAFDGAAVEAAGAGVSTAAGVGLNGEPRSGAANEEAPVSKLPELSKPGEPDVANSSSAVAAD